MENVFSTATIEKQLTKLKAEKKHRVELVFNSSAIKLINKLAKQANRSRKNYLENIVSDHCIKFQFGDKIGGKKK